MLAIGYGVALPELTGVTLAKLNYKGPASTLYAAVTRTIDGLNLGFENVSDMSDRKPELLNFDIQMRSSLKITEKGEILHSHYTVGDHELSMIYTVEDAKNLTSLFITSLRNIVSKEKADLVESIFFKIFSVSVLELMLVVETHLELEGCDVWEH